MPVIRLTDVQIATYLAEKKDLAAGWRTRLTRRRTKRGHQESELPIEGTGGTRFRIISRVSTLNPLNFSVILAMLPANSYEEFRLRRYNGRSHEHTNALEGDRFFDFHIHHATERYQAAGLAEDGYAVTTDRFTSMDEAIDLLADECGFHDPDPRQISPGTLET